MNSRSAACCSACTTRHVSAECRQCRHNARQPELNHVCAEGTMPKPSEEPLPREGEPKARAQQQPRSRYRADGRRRRTAGELKKRAPYVQYERCAVREGTMMGSQPPRQAKGDHSTSASTRMKIHLTPRMGDLPRRRTQAGTGSQSLAPGNPGLSGTGARSTGRMVTAEAGNTPHQALPGRSSGSSGRRISTTKRRTKPRTQDGIW